ncbi:MAG TPA: hypothetical protein VJU54_13115 [Nitrospiraceae bacterium]|nr:hypothetical protein [Nitrospiraceae bacterium]
MKSILAAIAAVSCSLALFAGGIALGQSTMWMDDLTRSVKFYQAKYPTTNDVPANWEPYLSELSQMKKSAFRGDDAKVRTGINNWFKMLKNREYGIDPKAADELFHIAVLTTPFDEYKISVPAQ